MSYKIFAVAAVNTLLVLSDLSSARAGDLHSRGVATGVSPGLSQRGDATAKPRPVGWQNGVRGDAARMWRPSRGLASGIIIYDAANNVSPECQVHRVQI